MFRSIAFLGIGILLSGCLGKLETEAAETGEKLTDIRKGIFDTNLLFSEFKSAELVKGALTFMNDPEVSPDSRGFFSKVYILQGTPELIHGNIGMQFPIAYAKVPRPGVDAPNVSIIGEKVDPVTKISPVNREKYDILYTACFNIATVDLPGQAQTELTKPGLSNEQIKNLKAKYADYLFRAVQACTGVLGAEIPDINEEERARVTKDRMGFLKGIQCANRALQYSTDYPDQWKELEQYTNPRLKHSLSEVSCN